MPNIFNKRDLTNILSLFTYRSSLLNLVYRNNFYSQHLVFCLSTVFILLERFLVQGVRTSAFAQLVLQDLLRSFLISVFMHASCTQGLISIPT